MKKITSSPLYLVVMVICTFFWILVVPGIIAAIMLIVKIIADKKEAKDIAVTREELQKAWEELDSPLYAAYKEVNGDLTNLNQQIDTLKSLLPELQDYSRLKYQIDNQNNEIQSNNALISRLLNEISELQSKHEKLSKQVQTQTNKLCKIRELYKSTEYCIESFIDSPSRLSEEDANALDEFAPSVILQLHCMEIKDLRKAFRENDKEIDKLLTLYASRYTTKSNRAIYQLMVIALRAELQNILYNLKYEKLDKCVDDVKTVTAKYLKIAGDGNQSIVNTLTKFIGEVEYLFINSVKIEYNYYVKKEQARQEQAAIREQMRQEAAERRALEEERKKIENEEKKYNNEIEKVSAQIQSTTDESELQKLRDRIAALQNQLSDVAVKKKEIVNLQNGKAGTVYIISNLGSFGENVFKVGMTRRMEPMDRVKELGDASVPFQFDVHSFIFSEDAVGLEHKMHQILDNRRVNKVNLRKEFFNVSLDEIEKIVYDIEPTAAFNRTMAAEEYRQSISSDFNYANNEADDFEDDLDDECEE